MFVGSFWVYRPSRFSLIWRCHHYRWRAANFDLCSALMTIEQWGFFGVPHLLWHGTSVYDGHLRGPVTLAPTTELLAVELSLSVLTAWIRTPNLLLAGPTLLSRQKIHFFLIFLSTPNHRPIKPQYKIMMTEGGSTKIIYFMTPEIYVLVMGRGHSSYTLKMHKSCSLLLGIYQTNWTKFHHPQGREFVKIL